MSRLLFLDITFVICMPFHLTTVDTGLKICASVLVIATNLFVLREKIKSKK